MPPKISILLTTGLLAAALTRLPHPSATPVGRSDGNPPARAEHRGEASAELSETIPDSLSAKFEPFDPTAPAAGRSTSRAPENPDPTGVHAPDESQPAQKPSEKSALRESASPVAPVERTIQLSENFRLPAAMMGRSFTPADRKPAAVEAITRRIEEEFYQKLGMIIPKSRETATADSDAGPNVVIEPDEDSGPVLDHADQLYRSLFGQEAFNRQTLNSAMEVRLPATAVSE